PMPDSLVKSLESSTSALAGSQAAQHSVRSSALAALVKAVEATIADASHSACFTTDFMPHLPFAKPVRMTGFKSSLRPFLQGENAAARWPARCLVFCLVGQNLLNTASRIRCCGAIRDAAPG